MRDPGPEVLFVGDLDDPWVASIADALPPDTPRLHRPGPLPDDWPTVAWSARLLVLHRAILEDADAIRLGGLVSGPGRGPRVVLIVGPHARFQRIERWVGLVDAILPEATAAETIARHLAARPPRRHLGSRPPAVAVVSSDSALRQVLTDAVRIAGFAAKPARTWDAAGDEGLAVWDVPVLEPDWGEALAAESARRRVIALLGFADRASVVAARAAGAAACLDLPLDPADLGFVLDRIAAPGRHDPPHAVPPPPAGLGRRREEVPADGDRAGRD